MHVSKMPICIFYRGKVLDLVLGWVERSCGSIKLRLMSRGGALHLNDNTYVVCVGLEQAMPHTWLLLVTLGVLEGQSAGGAVSEHHWETRIRATVLRMHWWSASEIM
jgi:hypothetical protein